MREAFEEEISRLSEGRNRRQSFDLADESFTKRHGFSAYSDYDSYRVSKHVRDKKKAKRNP